MKRSETRTLSELAVLALIRQKAVDQCTLRLLTRESRRSSLNETVQPLSGILAGEDLRHHLTQVFDRRLLRTFASDPCVGQGGLHPQRCLRSDDLGDLDGPLKLLASWYDLLHQTDAESFGSPELLSCQQESHGVSPAELRRRTESGTTKRHYPAANLQLSEAHVVGGHHNVGGEREFYRQGKGNTLDSEHHGFRNRLTPHSPKGSCRPGPFSA